MPRVCPSGRFEMFKFLGRTAAVVCLIALSAPLAQAQVTDVARRFVTFGIGGGVSVPVEDAGRAFDNGINAKGFVRFKTPVLPFPIGADLSYQKFDIASTIAQAAGGVSGVGQLLAGGASAE